MLLTKFHKRCWTERVNGVPGDAYAGEPLSAAMFVVPGDYTEQAFDVSIRGFALGNFVD